MKKILSLFLAFSLTAALGGCASGGESASSSSMAASEQSVSEETVSSSEAEESIEMPESAPTEQANVRLAGLKGPTTMGMVKLLEDNDNGQTVNHYTFTMTGTADDIVAKLAKGELDIAAVPCNLASVLYNNTEGGVTLAAVNTLGVLYVVETGDSIQSVEDLKGQSLVATGKGTTPEYSLNYILAKNGLDPAADLTIEYKSEATEVAAALASGTANVAMLPEPFVTTAMSQNDQLRRALNLSDEWDKIGDGSAMVTGTIVVRTAFLEENKEAVDAFLEEYQASIEYVNANVAEAAALVEKRDIAPAAVAQKAIPNCNIVYLDGADMRQKVEGYLQALYDQNPQSVGGALPDDAFYYQK